MRIITVYGAIVLLVLLLGCEDSTTPTIEHEYGVIAFHGEIYHFENVQCDVQGTIGGEPVYSLEIHFTDKEGRRISFQIQDPDNDPSNLIKPGLHLATGQHWDGIFTGMQPSTFTMNLLGPTQLAVSWDKVRMVGEYFMGRGHIDIFERLDLACASRIWIGGAYAYPGDPEYDKYYENYCAPGYYYPAQRIWFICENGAYMP